jgi:hypothetical protein
MDPMGKVPSQSADVTKAKSWSHVLSPPFSEPEIIARCSKFVTCPTLSHMIHDDIHQMVIDQIISSFPIIYPLELVYTPICYGWITVNCHPLIYPLGLIIGWSHKSLYLLVSPFILHQHNYDVGPALISYHKTQRLLEEKNNSGI